MRKEFPSDWSKLHHTQVKANIEYLLNNYKKYGVPRLPYENNVRIGDEINIDWYNEFGWYTINGRLVTGLTKSLYGPLDELFKACVSYRFVERSTKKKWNNAKPYVLFFDGLAVFIACVVMYATITWNYQDTVEEKVKEKLQQEYPDYSGYEERKQQITDSIKDCTNKFSAWRNREKGN
ncbi:MAG: hypothetical protein J5714_03035 [Alphaproteobacteria bacterium]|nr:hypothetical protein [Alphaproteobacteria bacterium]